MVAVEGVVRSRPTEAINADMKTGAIEVMTGLVLFLGRKELVVNERDYNLENLHYLVWKHCNLLLKISSRV